MNILTPVISIDGKYSIEHVTNLDNMPDDTARHAYVITDENRRYVIEIFGTDDEIRELGHALIKATER